MLMLVKTKFILVYLFDGLDEKSICTQKIFNFMKTKKHVKEKRLNEKEFCKTKKTVFTMIDKFSFKFKDSEKATKFCEMSTLLLTGTTQDKSKVKISQIFVAFSEYMNFIKL